MLKLLGPGLGTGFGPAGGSSLNLKDYKPPWEIEISFIALTIRFLGIYG